MNPLDECIHCGKALDDHMMAYQACGDPYYWLSYTPFEGDLPDGD